MIVSNIGALPEYLGEYPVYVEPGTDFIENLVRAMQQCIDSGDLDKKIQHSYTQGSGWYFEQFKKII